MRDLRSHSVYAEEDVISTDPLNRVLRHNLRNQVEVIRSNAEVLADESTNGYADSIIESADRLSELGRSARSIDKIVSQPSATAEVDLASVVNETAGDTRGRDGVDLSLSVPESTTLATERHAVVAAAESAVENALSRAANSVTVTLEKIPEGYSLTVVDDGSSMPDDEIASVSAGTETPLQHSTGIGLWQLKWAVTKFNGDLSIENDDGTAVEVRIPDQRR
jgi:signal transduction histidine kinase